MGSLEGSTSRSLLSVVSLYHCSLSSTKSDPLTVAPTSCLLRFTERPWKQKRLRKRAAPTKRAGGITPRRAQSKRCPCCYSPRIQDWCISTPLILDFTTATPPPISRTESRGAKVPDKPHVRDFAAGSQLITPLTDLHFADSHPTRQYPLQQAPSPDQVKL